MGKLGPLTQLRCKVTKKIYDNFFLIVNVTKIFIIDLFSTLDKQKCDEFF